MLAASVGLFVPDGLYWYFCSCWHYSIYDAKKHHDCHLHAYVGAIGGVRGAA